MKRLTTLLLSLVLTSLGCGGDFPPRILFEDFEDVCDGAPCGWSVTEGSVDDVAYVETIHPGVHGLSLSGDAVTVSGPGEEETSFPTLAIGSLQAEISIRCDDPDGRVVVRVLGEFISPDSVELFQGETFAEEGWGRFRFSLVGRSALAMPVRSAEFRIANVTISKRGAGTCVVDTLEIDDLGGF